MLYKPETRQGEAFPMHPSTTATTTTGQISTSTNAQYTVDGFDSGSHFQVTPHEPSAR